jgi:hypothetical protein
MKHLAYELVLTILGATNPDVSAMRSTFPALADCQTEARRITGDRRSARETKGVFMARDGRSWAYCRAVVVES